MVEWVQVLGAMVDGPTSPVAGVVEPEVSDDRRRFTVGWAGRPPVIVDTSTPVRIWRHGHKLRAELLTGEPVYRTDGTTAWQFTNGECVQAPIARVLYVGPGDVLIRTRSANDWTGTDFTRPTDSPILEIDFLGRHCWEVELAPPSHKPAPIQLVVDIDTGAVLQQRNDAFKLKVSYTEFAVIDAPPPDFFLWDGPAVSIDTRDAEVRAASERAIQDGIDWFRGNVTARPLRIEVPVDLDIQEVRDRKDDGSFTASLRVPHTDIRGVLARRPRSAEQWTFPAGRSDGPVARWSTVEHDWSLVIRGGIALDSAGLHRLQQLLHADSPAQESLYPV